MYDGNQELHLSPDGQQMARECDEDTIMIYDLSTGNCIQEIKVELWGRQFLANGNRLVLASNKDIEVWDILQSRCIAFLSMPSPKEAVGQSSSETESRIIYAVALSNDSNLIAVGDGDSIQVWDLTTQKLRHELDVRVTSLTFFSDKELMLYHNQAHDTVEILKLNTPHREWQKEWRLDPDDQSRLCTEFGIIDLTDILCGPDFQIEKARRQPPHSPHYLGYGLSPGGAWILKGGTRILCLPLEYRGKATAAGSTVAITHEESKRVSVLRFTEEGSDEDGG
ncbi:hypothetical protein FALCPG4_017882 [Fusarium falciforme]